MPALCIIDSQQKFCVVGVCDADTVKQKEKTFSVEDSTAAAWGGVSLHNLAVNTIFV